MTELRLTVDDFTTFFSEVTGHRPFDWQRRLLGSLAESGRWPDELTAPTGAGKSAAVEIHAFANALAVVGGARVPRRLAVVVGRRALVDSHAERAEALVRHLDEAAEGTVSARVREALRSLAVHSGARPLRTTVLRGAAPRDRSWVEDPGQCSIICATPEMFGSRLLLRGYGTSWGARPREGGLLAYDCAAVIDEGHLARQLTLTARRIPQLEGEAPELIGVAPLQVVSTTATPTSAAASAETSAEGVRVEDLEDPVLAMRLTAPKPVRTVPTEQWPGRRGPSSKYVAELVDNLVELVRDYGRDAASADGSERPPAATVGCVVNNVDTAGKVAEALRRDHPTMKAVLRTGRSRPYDVDREVREPGPGPAGESEEGSQEESGEKPASASSRRVFPGLFTVEGNDEVDVLISTQAIEVGVDLDLAAMLTELAPASALAQRFGRVNRLGQRETAELRVVVPSVPSGDYARPPYDTEELDAALTWLEEHVSHEQGAAPWAVAQNPPPAQELSRTLLQRPEPWNARHWSHTSLPMFASGDLDLFLRDDLDQEPAQVGVVVRDRLPEDSSESIALLTEALPRSVEVFPARRHVVRPLLSAILQGERRGSGHPPRRAFRVRGDEVVQLELGGAFGLDALSSGDVVVLDAEHRILRDEMVSEEPTRAADPVPWEELDGVLALAVGDEVEAYGPDWDPDEVTRRAAERHSDDPRAAGRPQAHFDLPDEGEDPSWILVTDGPSEMHQETVRQVWSSEQREVLLETHARAVADRARLLAEGLGLPQQLAGALEAAGLHHDDGKAARAFQDMLGADPQAPLAKSGTHSRMVQRQQDERSGKPRGWRHEQLSVVFAAMRCADDELKSLVLQLVGTTHGYGRACFSDGARRLFAADTDDAVLAEVGDEGRKQAQELFDTGRWDSLVEANRRRWGTWGTAYLEAVLRAADGQVSQEGS